MKTIISSSLRLRIPLRTSHAFTLLEVVIAVAILSLLSGTIYAVISGCIQIAVQAQTVEKDKGRMEHFLSLMRRSIMSMPDGAKLKLELLDGHNSVHQEFSLEGSADFFPFGERAISRSKTIFSLQPSPGGNAEDGSPRFALAMWRSDMIQADKEDDDGQTAQEVRPAHLLPDEKGRYWLPLIDNISTWTWGFWNSEDEKWEEEWEEEENPPLIEMKVTMGGQTLPERNVFTVYQMPKITVPKPAEDAREGGNAQMLTNNGNNANGNGDGGRNQDGQNGERPGRGGNRPGRGQNGDEGTADGVVPPPPTSLPPGFTNGFPGQGQEGGRPGGRGNGNGGGGNVFVR